MPSIFQQVYGALGEVIPEMFFGELALVVEII